MSGPIKFKPRREESQREERIANEAIVGARNKSERALSWYNYLQARLSFPFVARCRYFREDDLLPLGGIVQVIGMAKVELCMSQVLVKVVLGQRSVAAPLWSFEPLSADEGTTQAVGDWHYWVERGYRY